LDHPTVPPPTCTSPTVALIDLAALAQNLRQVRRLAGSSEILAVVKADAYGHGAVSITRTLAQEGVRRFGVATVQEGAQLRDAGVQGQILVMGGLLPAQVQDLLAYRLTPVIHEASVADALSTRLPAAQPPYSVHLKVDTGMGRLGLLPEEVLPLLQSSPFQSRLLAEGLMTHLADSDGADPRYTHQQIARFETLAAEIALAGFKIPLVHAANSAALIGHPAARFSAVRPGLMLYGYACVAPGQALPELAPVLSLRTAVVQVRRLKKGDSVSYNRTFVASRPSRIAVLPIGYADGYSRALSNKGAVLVHGRRCPVVGRVCMDMTLVDVTALPDVAAGDEAVVIGRQGEASVLAAEVAAWAGTIPYEVLCGIGPRVPRLPHQT
jgi:alanine racemase